MKFYLSSFGFGNEIATLKRLIPTNNKIGIISNAKDFAHMPAESVKQNKINDIKHHIQTLDDLGFKAEALDLKDYFGEKDQLEKKLNRLGALWVTGGNTFILRQAMRLSGFDELFESLQQRTDFLYGGYSAGVCVLSTSLKPLDRLDAAQHFPYLQITEPIWDGLGVFDYTFIPHYGSDYLEQGMINKEIQRCIDNKWLFKALKDGDVIVVE